MFVLRSAVIALVLATALAQTAVQPHATAVKQAALQKARRECNSCNDGNVPLNTAGNYAILSKVAISTVPTSVITGDIGVSPAAGTFMTGFSIDTANQANGFTESTQVVGGGKMFAANYGSNTPALMTPAVLDMEAAYTDAAGRQPTTDTDTKKYLNIHAGDLTGQTISNPGVYRWGSNIEFGDFTISGSDTDVFIFQTTGNVVARSGAAIALSGGVLAKNIVWQVAGYVDAGTTSVLQGTFLVKTAVTFKTGSTLYGRILAQTRVDLQQTTVTP